MIKTRAVLVVELPLDRLHHWPVWSREQGIHPLTYRGLAETGGDPNSWWITLSPVTRQDIIALDIAPLVQDGVKKEGRRFTGTELQKLFDSAEARDALELKQTGRWRLD